MWMGGSKKCAKPGCEKDIKEKQKYCSRAHAPLSHLRDPKAIKMDIPPLCELAYLDAFDESGIKKDNPK